MASAPKTANTATSVEAGIAGSALVVSFSGSGLPKLWRADLAHLDTAGLELRDEQGKVVLFLKTPSSSEDVYAFPDRDSAAAGLQAITRALLAQQRAPDVSAPVSGSGFFVRLLKYVFFGFLALMALGALATFLRPAPADVLMKAAGAPPLKAGIPLPADELLGK